MLTTATNHTQIEMLHIYVDGGYQPNPKDDDIADCTWGLCIISEHADGGYVFQGCSGGWVSSIPTDATYIGIRALTSFSAEIQAHLFARLLLFQSGFFYGDRKVAIGFDNMSAANAAGSYGAIGSESFVQKLCVYFF